MNELTAPIQKQMFCYNETAKDAQSRAVRKFFREAQKELSGRGLTFKTHFCRGGVAVWGETYLRVYRNGAPILEAYDTSMGLLVRQWDGRNSGANHYVSNLVSFVLMSLELIEKPFVRF